ncbi:hypothetical protein SELMODRAFT_404690 [Selaginella moellendorffii]|uniref:Uncharacterized protein n=1 Tax=Selaginella moellendorffii TaxID=88036 RepID=D8QW37_SELML|nr:hypothetical protein SELMODRAFT_404690 [Selaginella moellendorffii]
MEVYDFVAAYDACQVALLFEKDVWGLRMTPRTCGTPATPSALSGHTPQWPQRRRGGRTFTAVWRQACCLPQRWRSSPELSAAVWEGILMAFHGHETASQELRDLNELYFWCGRRREQLLFVVDDWEVFDAQHGDSEETRIAKDKTRQRILDFARRRLLVGISAKRYQKEQSLKRKLILDRQKFVLDGPFSQMELKTWLALSSLPESLKTSASIHYLTGGMPGLLECLEVANGDEAVYLELIQGYTARLGPDFVDKLSTPAEIQAGVNLVRSGIMPELLAGKLNFSCFYRDGSLCWRLLCPHINEFTSSASRRAAELQGCSLMVSHHWTILGVLKV